jgi:hypothetical protein
MSVAREQDFFGWAQEQSTLLRDVGALRLNAPPELDWEHLAEEIRLLGVSLERELRSRYAVLLLHLLKWQYQPGLKGSSWRKTIREQRKQIAEILEESPSLRARRAAEMARAYSDARDDAEDETGLPLKVFPEICPFSLDQVEDRDFWPEPDA